MFECVSFGRFWFGPFWLGRLWFARFSFTRVLLPGATPFFDGGVKGRKPPLEVPRFTGVEVARACLGNMAGA